VNALHFYLCYLQDGRLLSCRSERVSFLAGIQGNIPFLRHSPFPASSGPLLYPKVCYERRADIQYINEKEMILHSDTVNVNEDENTLCTLPFSHYYHLSKSGGITFAIFPPVRRALPVTIQ
jgi:hypothetical protein